MTEAVTAPATLTDVHRAYLNEHAVSDEIIEAQGIRSEGDDIVFTWIEGDQVTEQRRPWPGAGGVYYWTAGEDLHLNILRDPGPDAPVLLAEGTKQSLAVASWAPPEYAVMGMPGCYGWTMSRKLDLARFAGRQVLIMLDADAGDNLDVWEAGTKLAAELAMEDPPASALFIPSPAMGKNGIDDYLSRIAPERREDRLAKLIAQAQDKPAEKKPTKRKVKEQAPDTAGRPMVMVNRDRLLVIGDILRELQQRWGGKELFCYGGVLTRLSGSKAEPLTPGAFAAWLAEGVYTYRYRKPTAMTPGDYEPEWPDQQSMSAVMSLADKFAPLHRIARVPFFRADGTACFKNGYDWDTGTFLACGNSGMDRLDIPDEPSAAEATAAARFLTGEWLGDMPFASPASRASALALALTPFIRGLVPLVPLAVVSGLQPGVGKGLLGDCLSIMITGQAQPPLPYVTDDEDEIRKQITSAFRAGTDLFCFDEAHDLKGAALSRALTSITYTDRILGVSTMAEFPNRATWMSLGNNVEVNADMARRVHWIELHPDCPDPDTRPESAFTHPDLRSWTTENRPELVTAALVMIRGWFAAGSPPHSRGSLMGSFEAWDKMMSGILAHAGVNGFLDGLARRRSEADFAGSWWGDHIAWLHKVFGTEEFTVGDVKTKAQASSGVWDAPPELGDVMQAEYGPRLGRAYSKVGPRWFKGLRLVKTGRGHNNTTKWVIQVFGGVLEEGTLPDLGGGSQGGANPAAPPVPGDMGVQENGTILDLGVSKPDTASPGQGDRGEMGESSSSSRTRADAGAHAHAHDARSRTRVNGPGTPSSPPVSPQPGLSLGFDLETADAGDLFTYRSHDDRGFVRLAGVIGSVPVITDAPSLLPLLDSAAEVTGHNILGFDGLALAWHHGMDWESFAARARDTELIARQAWPPRSRETHSADKLGLDAVAGLLGVGGKTDDLSRLKREHGGWDKIPVDDPEYRAYLEGDLRATAAVAERLQHDDYTRREHKLASLAGRMSLNGFAVNQDLLAKRLEEGAQRKATALQVLHDGWGLPLGKMVSHGRGKAKHEEWEEAVSPLSTDSGRAWLEGQWERYQVPDPPRTAKAGKLALGADDLKKISDDPDCPPDLRGMLALMAVVTTTRTVYQTAQACLAPDGRVHPMISMRQSSGRWSTTNPGLTVFGKHGGRHVERDIFVPDEGYVLFSVDLSQVDMRGIAGHCQDPAYMAMFAPGQDAHEQIAAQVGLTRQQAKAIGHGWNYGLGANKMIASGMDPDVVYRFTNGMEARFPRLMAWREEIRARAQDGEILDNGFGRRMSADPSRAHTVGPALMGQGTAGDIMKEVLLRLDERCPELRPYYRVMVHDEQVFSCPEQDYEEISRAVVEAFTWEWRGPGGTGMPVPILCDLNGPGDSWGAISSK